MRTMHITYRRAEVMSASEKTMRYLCSKTGLPQGRPVPGLEEELQASLANSRLTNAGNLAERRII